MVWNMTKYLVATGLSYEDKRAEIGDVVDDLPEDATDELLSMGAIIEVPEEYYPHTDED